MQLFLAQIKWSWGIQFELRKSYYICFGFHSPVYQSYNLRAMKGGVQLQKRDFFELKPEVENEKDFSFLVTNQWKIESSAHASGKIKTKISKTLEKAKYGISI